MTIGFSNSKEFATTATEAWISLQARGLEVPGRDDDLVDLLHRALQVGEQHDRELSFSATVEAASLEQFVRAFFKSATPYVDMLKDILRWFENANAKQGPNGWKLAWGGDDIPELQYFRQSVRAFEVQTVSLELPAIPFNDCWPLVHLLGNTPSAFKALKLLRNQNYQALPASIRKFSYGYEHWYEKVLTLPEPPEATTWLTDLWNIIRCALIQLDRESISGRSEANEQARAFNYAKTLGNGVAIDSLCMLETDSWLLNLITCYGAILESPSDQAHIGSEVELFFGKMPRVSFVTSDSIETFAAFLELPCWERRHEFFSAWIASKIIDACSEHELELLHDSGVITLPFKCTEVARVLTAHPSRILLSERRSPLKDPAGKGRSENVQPDFGIWHKELSGEVCDLVVEVKHYLRPAKGSWADVFNDYARAHPSAKVVLVNYGPPGNSLDAVDSDVRCRCHLIGNLRPGQTGELKNFSDLVSRAVGPVVRLVTDPAGIPKASMSVILLDRSLSMTASRDAQFNLLRQYADTYGMSHIAIAAFDRDTIWDANVQGIASALNYPANAETNFTEIILRLLADYDELIFVTDTDGKTYIDRKLISVQELSQSSDGMEVLQVTKIISE